ncbi:Ppx/GppA phosphatase family protein [Streptomyces indicus]|uniref:Exopolyphosphatase / guanosine-5'-triphosphate,3'-diphosphate pyrophosphatase n=1 Tax=Streptomyces indicus TaxID=417292 RepID=A0A1G9GTZ0_9ACTN|nr:Ppx/GppA phosphatase family protein [Streptomyces indicus]SDL04128.1 exopolyphosphatase / guanosine-5'-triphosphate,3'-diphosphate pyrophosphatase [Streptomyces indicus]
MTRVAAVDCGTNSIRLLVADVDPETGELTDLDRRMTIVRLGQGVDRTGRLAPEALERTFAACREYAAVIKELGAEKVRFVATSASRDASNRDDFVRGVLDILGVEPEVITGDEEAQLSFAGAASAQSGRGDAQALRTLVFDVGGGSTEFVLGTQTAEQATVDAARSVDIGCVRLTERHGLTGGPLTDEQIAAVRADIDKALDQAAGAVPLTEADVYIGLAGTVTTLAGIALDLPEYDSAAIHRSVLPYQQVKTVTHRLIGATHDERAAIPVMHPGRVDVICAGALIVLAIMERTGAEELLVSEHDILDGIALSAA